jgi:hypothetical protein
MYPVCVYIAQQSPCEAAHPKHVAAAVCAMSQFTVEFKGVAHKSAVTCSVSENVGSSKSSRNSVYRDNLASFSSEERDIAGIGCALSVEQVGTG